MTQKAKSLTSIANFILRLNSLISDIKKSPVHAGRKGATKNEGKTDNQRCRKQTEKTADQAI